MCNKICGFVHHYIDSLWLGGVKMGLLWEIM